MHLKKLAAGLIATMMIAATAITANAQPVNYWQNWNNNGSGGTGSSSYTKVNSDGSQISVSWSSNANSRFNSVVGVGWKPGNSTRKIGYNLGSYNLNGSNGCSYFALYGWTTNSLVEYYVFQNWKNYVPTDWTKLGGTITSDGGTYNIYKHQQVNQPSISGTQTFWQIASIRTSQAPIGSNQTITFSNHVNGWKNAGFSLGSNYDYQMLAVEGYESSGNANYTVWDN